MLLHHILQWSNQIAILNGLLILSLLDRVARLSLVCAVDARCTITHGVFLLPGLPRDASTLDGNIRFHLHRSNLNH